MPREATPQDDQRALALAGAAWAFLDAESRGVGSEVTAALMTFQASWSQWSDSVLLGNTGIADGVLRLGSWDVNTRNAIRASIGSMLQSVGTGALSAAEANTILNAMPQAQPPSTERGVWFVSQLAVRFAERSTDPIVAALWSCARAVRGRGMDAGSELSRRTFELAEGVPAQTPAATAAQSRGNQNAATLIAQAQQRVQQIEEPFRITGRAPAPQSEIPWGPIIIGTGVLALGGILTVAMLRNKKASRRRGVRGLSWVAESERPHPLREAESQSRW